jgi:hypothetical protein
MRKSNEFPPVLLARKCPKDSHVWFVWCPYCRLEHSHSAEAGHRAAQCIAGPLKENGYLIALAGSAALRKFQKQLWRRVAKVPE